MLNPWTLAVQEIRAQTVIARSSDGQTIELPKSAVYGTPKIGQELRCIAATPGSEDAAHGAFAQRLVNELLGKNEV